MPSIEEYKNGQAARVVKKNVDAMRSVSESIKGSKRADNLLKQIEELEPIKVTEEGAINFIDNADKYAIGERICKCMFKDAPHTNSVFLDELAEGLVKANKAEFVTKEKAIKILKEGHGRPIVVTRVEGKYLEICRTYPKNCIYWNMEKHKLKCIKK